MPARPAGVNVRKPAGKSRSRPGIFRRHGPRAVHSRQSLTAAVSASPGTGQPPRRSSVT
ncbi:Uncharacterised protein [Amycolatopsis camponoti]|uniref:Uncharacterized protein n=1 Tax=Amycolatopsis camponoti TaxID=2606593 RepID=A0A6I8MB23_9PSEU|nr:Uncharacterised protein [Amycolatopsis camponoti]